MNTRFNSRRWRIAAVLGATLGLHYAREMGQGPLFTQFAQARLFEHALPCFVAAVGDVVLASASYAVVAALFRTWSWPGRALWLLGAAVWIAFGLGATALIERMAVIAGRWSYTDEMPTVLGIGLAPLLQWTLIPLVLLPLLRWTWWDSGGPVDGRGCVLDAGHPSK